MENNLIRKPTSEDLPALIPLWIGESDFHHELDPEYYTPTASDEDKQFEKYFLDALATNDPYFLIAEMEEKVVGFVMYKKGKADYFDTNIVDFGEVLELFVDPDFRKKGIGEKLVNEVEKFFKEEGLAYLKLEASSRNDNAIKFYQEHGFEDHVTVMYKKIS